MDFLMDLELFNQILVSPDHITIDYCFSFSSIQITIHIKINQPISYLHICIFLLLTYFLLTLSDKLHSSHNIPTIELYAPQQTTRTTRWYLSGPDILEVITFLPQDSIFF
jgi:hypothetical protein